MSEPVTLLTDYLLGGLSLFWGGILIRQEDPSSSRSRQLWGWSLAVSGLAAITGGTSHGFSPLLSEEADGLLWTGTLILSGTASFLLLASACFSALSRPAVWYGIALGACKLIVFLLWIWGRDDFLVVVADYGGSLLAVSALQFNRWSRRRISALWILTGVLLSFTGAAIQQSGFSLHSHFNHNDLFHVIQIVAFYTFFRGGKTLTDRAAGPARKTPSPT